MHIRMLSTLVVCMLSAGFVQGAPEVDDSVIAALDAEIAQTDGGSTGGKGDGAKADELIKSIEEEIAGLGVGGEAGRGVGKTPSVPSNGQQGNAGVHFSKDSKCVIMSARGSAKTKARAEEIACCNAVWSALCKYAGTDLVKKNSDAVKKRTMSVAKNVIERHEIVEESEGLFSAVKIARYNYVFSHYLTTPIISLFVTLQLSTDCPSLSPFVFML